MDLEQFTSSKKEENKTLHNIISLEQYSKKMVSESKKESPYSSEEWWENCINDVEIKVIADKTTSKDNLRQKIKDYASNYIVYLSEVSYIQRDAYLDDIADEVEKDLEDIQFDQSPPASVAAQVARKTIHEQPENKFIKLR